MSTQSTPGLEADTIVAIATPGGRGGIGVVRLSGPAALPIATAIVSLRVTPTPRHVHFGAVVDAHGQRLDDALLTWFQAPASYTGEDVVEISAHGSPVVLQAVLQAAMHHGARLARAGEFTERAYLAGKMDLTAAEAVRDLIDAQTLEQARLAAEQLGGSLAREIAPVKQALVALIAALEAGIDFAEDDLDTLSSADLAARIAPLLPPLERLEDSFARGRLLREGVKLAIVGKPNAGKSSLFNRLLGRDRAIVTPVVGTTRDVVGESLVLGGMPIHLLDTAGLRDTTDPVERIGVERSREAIAEADLLLHLLDATDHLATAVDPGPEFPVHRQVLTVWNKADLLDSAQRARLQAAPHLYRNTASNRETPRAPDAFPTLSRTMLVSAVTGEGIEALQAAIVQASADPAAPSAGAATLTNTRQHAAVAAALQSLRQAHEAVAVPHEMLLLTLYTALESLDVLTGQTTTDDVLSLIFSTFCIGK